MRMTSKRPWEPARVTPPRPLGSRGVEMKGKMTMMILLWMTMADQLEGGRKMAHTLSRELVYTVCIEMHLLLTCK